MMAKKEFQMTKKRFHDDRAWVLMQGFGQISYVLRHFFFLTSSSLLLEIEQTK